jgi:hypothetical protein
VDLNRKVDFSPPVKILVRRMRAKSKIEFGDFQTPPQLAAEVAAMLHASGQRPKAIVEPTCGLGGFLLAAANAFPTHCIYGFDVNPEYVAQSQESLRRLGKDSCHVQCQDFFQVDWKQFLGSLGDGILILGNPPWVTNSALSVLGSGNLPQKNNFQGHRGLAAKTGKANFDISEWMLIRLLDSLGCIPACLAMLCKTSTARKVLRHAWRNRFSVGRCSLHAIDAPRHFDAAVDACLLIAHTGEVPADAAEHPFADVFADLSFDHRTTRIGLVEGELVADLDAYRQLRAFDGVASPVWRSGVKHDAAAIMELRREGNRYRNGRQEELDLEPEHLFPLLKSSDLANGRTTPTRWVLVTQRRPADDTAPIETAAPRTWRYLTRHAASLDARRSIIYRNRPRFSVFGVGDYAFAPWKVAVSGLYKNLRFETVGPFEEKPVVFDDTCCFLSYESEADARRACSLLNSDPCRRFLRSLVFLDSKRPVTVEVLNRVALEQVAALLERTPFV